MHICMRDRGWNNLHVCREAHSTREYEYSRAWPNRYSHSHKYLLHNTREYPTNIRVFDICEYSCSNEYEYSIFASISRVFELRLSPGARYRSSIEYTRHSRVLLVGNEYAHECEYRIWGPQILVSTRWTLYRGPHTVFWGRTGILAISSVIFH
jgi:hypothetical protein